MWILHGAIPKKHCRQWYSRKKHRWPILALNFPLNPAVTACKSLALATDLTDYLMESGVGDLPYRRVAYGQRLWPLWILYLWIAFQAGPLVVILSFRIWGPAIGKSYPRHENLASVCSKTMLIIVDRLTLPRECTSSRTKLWHHLLLDRGKSLLVHSLPMSWSR